jgi:flagellar biosynthetic protein FlhB
MAENDNNQDQKTEEPTPRRLQKAMEEGQIAFSSELLGGLAVLVGMFFFLLMGKWFFELIKNAIRQRLTFVDPMIYHPETILLAIRRDLTQVGIGCLYLMLPIAAVTIMVGFLQTRFNLTTKPLTINFNKLQPDKGLKRIFSTRSLNRGMVAIAKATAITVAAYLLTMSQLEEISAATSYSFGFAIQTGAELILAVGFLSAALMVIVGIIDYGFQKWKHHQEMKMSLQEVRDEMKETEGDPQIKARMRRLQQEMRKNRMLGDVPEADVTITNPTHFAVSLRYKAGKDEAPVVVAKGADFLAQKIIEISKNNGVPVVERKPVARFLYANVEVGQEIPYELYQAVAEILNFVKRLERGAA